MTISKIDVLDQTSIPGSDSQKNCGVHSFKNSLLFLLLKKKLITNEVFTKLVKDKQFFLDINAVLKKTGMPVVDLRPEHIVELHEMIQAGDFDLSKYGISQDDLNSLNLNRDGFQDISVFELAGYPHEPCFGAIGHPVDLLNAAAAAKFIRLKGEGAHVFAAGLGKGGPYGHWITAIVTKDLKGKRSWQFMDSWHNETAFSTKLINLIEKVLKKNESQLQEYLIEAYDASTDLINRRYKLFFDVTTNTVKPGIKIDMDGQNNLFTANQFYLERNREEYVKNLNEMYLFMKESGWLLSGGEAEIVRMKQLYAIANYMHENLNNAYAEQKEGLGLICKQVSASISRLEKEKEAQEENAAGIHEEVKPGIHEEVKSDIHDESEDIKFKRKNFEIQLGLLKLKLIKIRNRAQIALGNGETSNHKKLRLAYDAANTLYEKLLDEGDTYFKNPTKATYKTFKANCNKHVDNALKELSEHRGWTEFLVNLALGLSTLGLGILIKGAVNHANNRHFLFVCKTDSEKEVDNMMTCINSAAPVA